MHAATRVPTIHQRKRIPKLAFILLVTIPQRLVLRIRS
jgi:hypothetical protein